MMDFPIIESDRVILRELHENDATALYCSVFEEVLKNVIRFGFDELGLNTIVAEIDPHNIPSAAILKKHGFMFIERKKKMMS